MPLYHVQWEIDVRSRSPREAAKKAQQYQRGDGFETYTVLSANADDNADPETILLDEED